MCQLHRPIWFLYRRLRLQLDLCQACLLQPMLLLLCRALPFLRKLLHPVSRVLHSDLVLCPTRRERLRRFRRHPLCQGMISTHLTKEWMNNLIRPPASSALRRVRRVTASVRPVTLREHTANGDVVSLRGLQVSLHIVSVLVFNVQTLHVPRCVLTIHSLSTRPGLSRKGCLPSRRG